MKVHAHPKHLSRATALVQAMGHDVEGDNEGATEAFIIIESSPEMTAALAADVLGNVLAAALGVEVRLVTGNALFDYNRARARTFSTLPGARTQAALDAVVRNDLSIIDMLEVGPATRDMLLREVFDRVPQERIDALRLLWEAAGNIPEAGGVGDSDG